MTRTGAGTKPQKGAQTREGGNLILSLFDNEAKPPQKGKKKRPFRSPNTRNPAIGLSGALAATCRHSWAIIKAEAGTKSQATAMACTNCGATWDQCPTCQGNTPPEVGPGGLSHMPSTANREWIKEKQCPPDSHRVHIPAINGTAGIPANTFALYEQAEGGEYRRTKILTGHQ